MDAVVVPDVEMMDLAVLIAASEAASAAVSSLALLLSETP